jgi:tetratricopeptide (TPR) repeat protein
VPNSTDHLPDAMQRVDSTATPAADRSNDEASAAPGSDRSPSQGCLQGIGKSVLRAGQHLCIGIGSFTGGLRKLIGDLVSIAGLSVFGLIMVLVLRRELDDSAFYIEPLVVAEPTLPTMAVAVSPNNSNTDRERYTRQLVDEIHRLQNLTRRASDHVPGRASALTVRYEDQLPNFSSNDWSVAPREVVRYLRGLFPAPGGKRVSGEIFCVQRDQIATGASRCALATLRLEIPDYRLDVAGVSVVIAGQSIRTSNYPYGDVDSLLREGAFAFVRALDPCNSVILSRVAWTPSGSSSRDRALAQAESAAIRCVKRAQDTQGRIEAYSDWARLLGTFKAHKASADVYELASAQGAPLAAGLYLNWAMELYGSSRTPEAIAEAMGRLDDATHAGAGDATVLAMANTYRGIFASDDHRYDEAIQYHERALQGLDGTSADTVRALVEMNLGNVLRDKGECSGEKSLVVQAERHNQRAIRSDPSYALAYNGLARTHATLALFETDASARRNWLSQAIREYMLAIELDPSAWEFENSLANAYAEIGDLDAARGHHFEAAQDSPDSAFLHVDWAKTHLREVERLLGMGETPDHYIEEARKEIDYAAQHDPGSPYVAEARAIFARLTGNLKEAAAQYQLAITVESERCPMSVNARRWAEALRQSDERSRRTSHL